MPAILLQCVHSYGFVSPDTKMKILVAPLDWGLGHATRCIPIITELIKQGHEVILAADGASGELLKQEFPTVLFVSLHGYRVKYFNGLSLATSPSPT